MQVRLEAALTLRAMAEVDPSCVNALMTTGVETLRAVREGKVTDQVRRERQGGGGLGWPGLGGPILTLIVVGGAASARSNRHAGSPAGDHSEAPFGCAVQVRESRVAWGGGGTLF